uniref:Uncharacterized protein n=1 Tax=Caenorhabditis japonica TaxID=281687 RepID=A0A8R1I6Z3_CAEJA
MFQSRSTNAQQGPPPNRPMPRPPGGIIMPTPSKEHDYTNDYEDPEEMAARSRGDGFTNHLLIKTTPPPVNFNSYEMSMSQQFQRRSQQHQPMAPPLSDCWGSQSHGNDGGVLHKNADGAYYIPSGSYSESHCETCGTVERRN